MTHSKLSHHERMQALIANQPIDRTPVALWRHFPMDDQDPEMLAAATLDFQSRYDFDLIKVTPASSFCLKDWGAEDRWEGNPEGTRRYSRHVIQSPGDWEKLILIKPEAKFLSQQLECLRILRKEIDHDTPVIQTIFSPLSQAKNLAGGEVLLSHIRSFPELVQIGLDIIGQSTMLFVKSVIEIGIDGIFYAVQHAQAELLTQDEYVNFGKTQDVQILQQVRSLWCNILHLHGTKVYFDLVKDLPVQIINWHDRDTDPSLEEAFQKYQGILCGGIKRETLSLGTPDEIGREITDAIRQVGGRRLLLGTGCVISSVSPHGNIKFVRSVVEQ